METWAWWVTILTQTHLRNTPKRLKLHAQKQTWTPIGPPGLDHFPLVGSLFQHSYNSMPPQQALSLSKIWPQTPIFYKYGSKVWLVAWLAENGLLLIVRQGWLAGWLAGRLAGWLGGWLGGWLVDHSWVIP